jgi:FkbM family methyltransferase
MMPPRLALLMLPYTRAEFLHWAKLMKWANVGWEAGDRSEWKALPVATVRGKQHKFLMKLDRSDWSQRSTFFLGRYYELGVLRTLDLLLRPGDHFVDIGANIGMITLHARHLVGAAGRVDSFEPNPECAAAVREHVAMNKLLNVFLHQCGLSDSSGTLTLNLADAHTGTATFANVGGPVLRTVDVDVRVGDDMISTAPRLIKIDVEGYEMHVLKGLVKTLERSKPFLITELIDGHLARAGSSVAAVFDRMTQAGYMGYAIGLRRRRLRQRLILQPVLVPADLGNRPDVLWAHRDQEFDATPFADW